MEVERSTEGVGRGFAERVFIVPIRKIVTANVLESSGGGKKVEKCVIKKVKAMTFEMIEEDPCYSGPLIIKYPFGKKASEPDTPALSAT